MEFGLAEYVSDEISKKSYVITTLSEDIKGLFINENYGDGLKSLFIGIVCVSPQFETFFKPKKPKYIKDKKTFISQATGVKHEIERCLEYDVKIDFETFKNAGEEEAKKILAKEILASLTIVEQMKTKIKDFDLEAFKSDLVDYFQERKLL